MQISHHIAPLIDLIQDAAFDAGLLAHMMRKLASHFSTIYASIEYDSPTIFAKQLHYIESHQNDVKDYESYYASRSLTRKDGMNIGVGDIYVDSMFHDQSALQRSETHNFFRERQMHNLMYACLTKEEQKRSALVLRRGDRGGSFDQEDFDKLRLLFPHIRQTLRMRDRLAEAERYANGLEAALDRLSIGAVILDRLGRVRFANRTTESILQDQDGLSLDRSGCLQAANRADHAVLQRCIATTIGGGIVEQAALVSRPSGCRSYTVTVSPAPSGSAVRTTTTMALVFIADPEQIPQPDRDMLVQAFGLSAAELRVALALYAGLRPQEIATLLALSGNTVKSHLKAIFLKTETASQADLRQRIAALVPPLRIFEADHPASRWRRR